MDGNPNTVIESLGVYLPPKSVTTNEILAGCKKRIRFPLEKITGIKTRPMAGQNEFAIDLARKAIGECLDKSKYHPEDIDLLICCNISRYDDLNLLSFEPSTSIKLRKDFDFSKALVFDITNACAGMFTGIYIVDALIKAGAIRCGIVVSGECITHLTQTAQREIESFMDQRLACLTLGDAGAAIILEKGYDNHTGFQKIELQTLGRYSPYCIGKEAKTGGWIMYTDSVNLTDVAIRYGGEYALNVLQQAGWPPDTFQHLIMHQTSRMTLNSAIREINHLLKSKIFHNGNTINNLAERGNTASTSHFIAIADQIRNEKIQSEDKVVFHISASGLTIGTALYVFDDFPDRFREIELPQKQPKAEELPIKNLSSRPQGIGPRIRIESVGTIPIETTQNKDSLEFLHLAATNCLEKSSYLSNDIELLIHSGVYRNEYLLEPAYAALLAGKLDMNATMSSLENKKTLAFDIFNGSMGFLNACYVAQQMIGIGNCKTAMVVASEIENNAQWYPDELLGISETASALILDENPSNDKGFSRFIFNYHLEFQHTYTTYCSTSKARPHLQIEKEANLEELYIACILPTVRDLLQMEDLAFEQINKIFPPQISSQFIKKLSKSLKLPLEKFVNIVGEGPNLFSSSLAYALEYAFERELVKPGDTGLMISVGSGIQVGCAIYQF